MTQDLDQLGSRRLQVPLAVLSVMACLLVGAQTTFEDLFEVAKGLNDDAKASQARIDDLDDERTKLFNDYRVTLKQIEGAKVYNRQLQLIVNKQLDKIAKLKNSIEDVTSIQREITPLMLRMIEILDQFVANDLPFLIDERLDRIDKLRTLMDDPDVSNSEKFSQVLRAFQIESEYGRTIEAVQRSITVDGQERTVDVLRIGRLTLAFQTSDGKETGWWNPTAKQWEKLGDSFTIPIRNGLKIARKQRTQGLIRVPILVPETASN